MKKIYAPLILPTMLIAFLLSGCTANGTVASSPPVASATPEQTQTSPTVEPSKPGCQDVATEDHVRTMYVHFANELARFGYYKLGRSTSELIARPAMDTLKIFYGGDALDQVIKLSAKWPEDVDISFPKTKVNSFKFSEKCNSVELNTTEVWSITKAEGGPNPELCLEIGETHNVTLEKQPDGITWKVTKITNFPACLQIPVAKT